MPVPKPLDLLSTATRQTEGGQYGCIVVGLKCLGRFRRLLVNGQLTGACYLHPNVVPLVLVDSACLGSGPVSRCFTAHRASFRQHGTHQLVGVSGGLACCGQPPPADERDTAVCLFAIPPCSLAAQSGVPCTSYPQRPFQINDRRCTCCRGARAPRAKPPYRSRLSRGHCRRMRTAKVGKAIQAEGRLEATRMHMHAMLWCGQGHAGVLY